MCNEPLPCLLHPTPTHGLVLLRGNIISSALLSLFVNLSASLTFFVAHREVHGHWLIMFFPNEGQPEHGKKHGREMWWPNVLVCLASPFVGAVAAVKRKKKNTNKITAYQLLCSSTVHQSLIPLSKHIIPIICRKRGVLASRERWIQRMGKK